LIVPDLEVAASYYERFGLATSSAGNALELRAEGPHRWGRYHAGRTKALNYLSFGAYEQDVPVFRQRLQARGVEILRAPATAVDEAGMWFRDVDGNLVELRVAEKSSPNAKATVTSVSSPPGTAGAPLRADAPFVKPRRLSHVLIFSTDVQRSVEFYNAVLGTRLSDQAADIIAFVHGIHGSDHHLVAFAKSDAPGFHHCSWDVGSVNDVGLGAMQMADAGHRRGWGLGRHVLGSNYFHYVRDPWGSYCEYSHDIDYVPAGFAWKSSLVSPDNGFYLWGPDAPEDFAYNYESPSASLTRELTASEPR
jgi:catechol 2,3-dioxygenase